MEEIWKEIEGYPNYKISNLGRVKSLRKILSSNRLNGKKYPFVRLYNKSGSKNISIHRLVALNFLPNPANKDQVNHKDGNKKNNRVDNLEWCSGSENVQHSLKHDLFVRCLGESNGAAKLTEEEVIEIYKARKKGVTQAALSKKYNISVRSINRIENKQNWKDTLDGL